MTDRPCVPVYSESIVASLLEENRKLLITLIMCDVRGRFKAACCVNTTYFVWDMHAQSGMQDGE